MSRFELLAPAGSPEALRAAVNAGADAVYIGGSAFGARAYADNADTDSLIDCIRYCHLRGRKLYLTVNTLFKEDELENRLFSFLRPYYEAGLDAVIVQDMGAIDFISSHFPGLPIHLSTQTAITMAQGTKILAEKYKSITRVVPARELSIKEIERFRRDCDLEMEIFIHGALCYCYSGQCLMSSMIGGRSGNRGRCAQPCRKLYDGKYLLSPKDQCLLPMLHELLDTGIESLKIEGRMKSPEYTAGVVSVYRRYIDKYEELGSEGYREWLLKNSEDLKNDMLILQDLYNRGGFNTGYLKQHNGPDMMTFYRPNHSGVEVGEVIAVRGREAVIRFSETINPQDVLEIRAEVSETGNKKQTDNKQTDNRQKEKTFEPAEKSGKPLRGHSVFEYTVKDRFTPGMTTSCITMKDRKAEAGMKVYRIRNNMLLENIREQYIEKESKTPVCIEFSGHAGSDSRLMMSLETGDTGERICAEVRGNVVETAKNAPSDETSVKKQLVKLGDTCFSAGEVSADIGDNVFIPSGELNRLRREAAEKLENKLLERYERQLSDTNSNTDILSFDIDRGTDIPSFYTDSNTSLSSYDAERNPFIYSVWNEASLEAVIREYDGSADIYYNIADLDLSVIDRIYDSLKDAAEKSSPDGATPSGFNLFIGLPYICRSDVYDRLCDYIISIKDRYPDIAYVARSQEEMHFLKEKGMKYRTDYNLYVMNNRAKKHYNNEFTLPLELNYEELKDIADPASEMIVYGYQPVMFSAQCVYKNKFRACKNSGHDFITITDELGHDFRCMQDCAFCYNIIYNSAKLDLTDKTEDIHHLPIRAIRYDFTFESPDEIVSIIRGDRDEKADHSTHGHFLRGVQ